MEKAGNPPGEQQNDTPNALRQRLGSLDPRQIAAWRAMRPARRLELAFQAYQFALDTARLTERQRNPDLPRHSADEGAKVDLVPLPPSAPLTKDRWKHVASSTLNVGHTAPAQKAIRRGRSVSLFPTAAG